MEPRIERDHLIRLKFSLGLISVSATFGNFYRMCTWHDFATYSDH